MDDDDLLARVAAGDDAALRDLFGRHAPWLAVRLRAVLPAADVEDVLRRVAAEAPRWLAPGGHLLSEISERQAPRAVEAFAGAGLIPQVARSEELNATVVIGTRTA